MVLPPLDYPPKRWHAAAQGLHTHKLVAFSGQYSNQMQFIQVSGVTPQPNAWLVVEVLYLCKKSVEVLYLCKKSVEVLYLCKKSPFSCFKKNKRAFNRRQSLVSALHAGLI